MLTMIPRWVYYLLGATILGLLIAMVVRLLTPDSIPIPPTTFMTTNVTNTSSEFNNVRFVGNEPDFPDALAIGSAAVTQLTATTIVDTLQARFNLQADPSGRGDYWTSEAFVLMRDPRDNRYVLIDQSLAFRDDGDKPDQAAAVAAAEKMVADLFPSLGLSAITQSTAYYSADGHFTEAEHEDDPEAKILKIPFAYTLNGYPLFYENKSDFPFELFIDSDHKLRKLYFYPQFMTIQTVGEKKRLSVETAINNINTRNLASVVSITQQKLLELSLDEITGAELNSVSLEYRHDPAANLVLPFYRFQGTAQNQTGDSLLIQLITPAVEVGR